MNLNLQMFVKYILCTFQNVGKENVGCFAQCQSSSACLESLANILFGHYTGNVISNPF